MYCGHIILELDGFFSFCNSIYNVSGCYLHATKVVRGIYTEVLSKSNLEMHLNFEKWRMVFIIQYRKSKGV